MESIITAMMVMIAYMCTLTTEGCDKLSEEYYCISVIGPWRATFLLTHPYLP